MKITLDDILSYHDERCKAAKELVAKKGHDYNRKFTGENHLFNLFVSEMLGIVDKAEQGVLTRLTDKFMRVISLYDNAPMVEDESVEVTIDDAINYFIYVGLIIRKRKEILNPKPSGETIKAFKSLDKVMKGLESDPVEVESGRCEVICTNCNHDIRFHVKDLHECHHLDINRDQCGCMLFKDPRQPGDPICNYCGHALIAHGRNTGCNIYIQIDRPSSPPALNKCACIRF